MPPTTTPQHDLFSEQPLADYFFIAGIESSRVIFRPPGTNGIHPVTPALGTTVEEETPENLANGRPGTAEETHEAASSPARHRNSTRSSWDARKSIASISGLDPAGSKGSASNRSSATIRPTPSQPDAMQQDFEAALTRFTVERDSVIEDLNFSSGQVPQPSRPRPKPKVQRIKAESEEKGSLRRRLSTMNPLARSNTATKKASARQSKRMSGYNSVIPAPQRFSRSENVHPLKRPFEPALLDRYPTKEMTADDPRRAKQPFPDFVPMFVFPNDINVVSSDARPRSTWHGFVMTGADGAKLHGITLIVWIPLADDAAEDLEYQCEAWRRQNMTPEEREMANSLGERLAAERTRLSELLAELREGDFASSEDYEVKQDQLSATEEKIQVLTDILKPVRHGAASKIEGLTDGDSGLWMPRAYGILGREHNMTGLWKEWLRAIAVPMTNGAVLRVPPSSPRVGIWQPLERYVVNLCYEAVNPIKALTQVELSVRELRLYGRHDAVNEIPGSRNADLYALFRSLQIPDIIVLFEYVMAESRIILLSSHTSMLYLVSRAIAQLLYPLQWAGAFIPVLPARLIHAIEGPFPYIIGIERRYENVELPSDDFVLVDLDQGIIEATHPPFDLPRQQRRKLNSILSLAAPHQYRYGVGTGPPLYATDAFPNHLFCSENTALFDESAPPATLAHLANLSSSSFGTRAKTGAATPTRVPTLNAFSQFRRRSSMGGDRPNTASTTRTNASPPSPSSMHFSPTFAAPREPVNALQASLRQQRSGQNLEHPRRQSSFGLEKTSLRKGAAGHQSNLSISTLSTDAGGGGAYAPSVYAQSTLAASTVMPNVLIQPVQSTDTTQWVEGHCMQWRAHDDRSCCSACDDKADDGIFRCSGCGMMAHHRCLQTVCLVCPVAFHADQVHAAFARCMASLFYTYRKSMSLAGKEDRKVGKHYKFNFDAFVKSVPSEHAGYIRMLRETQAFNVFIDERETKPASEASVRLFDEIILSKRNRGGSSLFSKSKVSFLDDTSDHLWRTAAATGPGSRQHSVSSEQTVGRAPAQLDPALLKEPRVLSGAPRMLVGNRAALGAAQRRKPVPSMLSQDLRVDTSSS